MRRFIGLTLASLVFCAYANAKMSEAEYKCSVEKNPEYCVKYELDKLDTSAHEEYEKLRKSGISKEEYLSKEVTAGATSLSAVGDISKYCTSGDGILSFFSKKKESKIKGRACEELEKYLLRKHLRTTQEDLKQMSYSAEDVKKINILQKQAASLFTDVAKTGCENGNRKSCQYLFLVYHPYYNDSRDVSNTYRIEHVIKRYVEPDLKISINAYRKACEIKEDKRFCREHEDYLEN